MNIEKWGLVLGSALNGYQAPELQTFKIIGKVYGHEHFEDGTFVTTSAILKIEEGIAFTASGSKYKLGKVHPEYLLLYPNALDLLNGVKSNHWINSMDFAGK